MHDVDEYELAFGTVGWPDTTDDPFELGDGSDAETALTLVQVTLFPGYGPTTELDQTQAQGRRLLCQLGALFFCCPPRGSRVIVGIPATVRHHPGAAVILQVVDRRGQQIFGADYQAGDVVVPALTSSARLALKGDGSVTLTNDKATIQLDANGNVTIDVPSGAAIALAGGGNAVARSGDAVQVAFSVSAPSGGGPCAVTPGGTSISGTITGGSSAVSSG